MGALNAATGAISSLAGIASSAQLLGNTIGAFRNIANPERNDDLALKQLQAQQNLNQQQLAEQTALERERIALQSSQDEESRRAALRRAVARQKAQFGASGITSGGSSDAVLLGLFNETDDELQRRNQLDTLRNAALDLDIAQQRSVNILQATQLQEKQKLGRLF